jgi:hypothetical protein
MRSTTRGTIQSSMRPQSASWLSKPVSIRRSVARPFRCRFPPLAAFALQETIPRCAVAEHKAALGEDLLRLFVAPILMTRHGRRFNDLCCIMTVNTFKTCRDPAEQYLRATTTNSLARPLGGPASPVTMRLTRVNGGMVENHGNEHWHPSEISYRIVVFTERHQIRSPPNRPLGN